MSRNSDFHKKIQQLKNDDVWHTNLAEKIMKSSAPNQGRSAKNNVLFLAASSAFLLAIVFTVGFIMTHSSPEGQQMLTQGHEKSTKAEAERNKTAERYVSEEVLDTYNQVFPENNDGFSMIEASFNP